MPIMRLKGIKIARSKGRVYYYHRATRKRIAAAFGSAAFVAEVAALDAAVAGRATRPEAGTLGALIAAYRASPEHKGLAARTRSDYGKVFDWLKSLDGMMLSLVDRPFVIRLRDRAFKKHKRRFANYVVQVVRLLLSWAVTHGVLSENPATGAKTLRKPREEVRRNRAWSDAEAQAILDAAGPRLRLAIGLGLYVGIREGDMIRLPRSAYDGEWLRWRQGKTGNLVEVPAHAGLRALIDGAPKDDTTLFVTGERKRPYATESGFRAVFFRHIRKVSAEKKLEPGLTYHGLRHTAARRMIEAGADLRMVQAVLGQRTLSMALHYSDEADRRLLASAAIVKLEQKADTVGKRKRTPKENR